MITAIVSFILGLVAGLLISRKHRSRLDGVEAKSKELLSALKGK